MGGSPSGWLPVEVVVPLRWDGADETAHADDLTELTCYLERLCRSADVTVVDGSRPGRFAQHHAAWAGLRPSLRHLPPEGRPSRNAKVVGAMTGIRLARHDQVVLADDDVRYDADTLRAVHDLLTHADLVRPANLFATWPWHARWDAGRSMLNRALAADWPGTFGLRRQYTRDMLVTGEQFGIGGMDSVRGFLEREISNDNGYRGTMEFYSPDFGNKTGVAGARMRGLFFADWGHVARNQPGPGEIPKQGIWSMGTGLRFSKGTNLAARVDYAIVQDAGGVQKVGNSRVLFSVSYIF